MLIIFPRLCFGGSVASGVEGVLTLSIGMRVSPEPGAVELLERYRLALNYAINKIISQNLRTIGEVHRELYRELREWFGFPSRIAIDCYRDAPPMQRLGGGTLTRVNALGLRGSACYCTPGLGIELERGMLR